MDVVAVERLLDRDLGWITIASKSTVLVLA